LSVQKKKKKIIHPPHFSEFRVRIFFLSSSIKRMVQTPQMRAAIRKHTENITKRGKVPKSLTVSFVCFRFALHIFKIVLLPRQKKKKNPFQFTP
jgi:hypothetical protein